MINSGREELLPQSLRIENKISFLPALIIAAGAFLLLFSFWLLPERELFRDEGFFAAAASEIAAGDGAVKQGLTVSAHHVILDNAWPMYPFVVSLFYRLGLPMESSLRIVSVLMLGILSLISGITVKIRCNSRSGIVAGCCCFGTVFALCKGFVGTPEIMAGVFLLTAQLLFFHYGSRLASWNSAWLSAAVFVSLGFLTAGPVVILYFAFPLLFLRRPLSSGKKYSTPGFAAGVFLLGVVVAAWALPAGLALHQYAAESGLEAVPLAKYCKEVITFPFYLIIRLMPFSVIMWLPFCVALQENSRLPVFCLYLRTLFFSMLALTWLLPGTSTMLIAFLIGPLSILTGIMYDFGVRRYGAAMRNLLGILGGFFPVAVVVLMLILFLPESKLSWLGDPAKMIFRNEPLFFWGIVVASAVLILLSLIFYCGIKKLPVWMLGLILTCGIGLVNISAVLPYCMMEKEWRDFGSDIRKALPEKTKKLYKYDIEGMFCGLFYAGVPVYKVHKDAGLPAAEKNVYLISTHFPDISGYHWRPLLPADYTCRGVPVSLWHGKFIEPEEFADEK